MTKLDFNSNDRPTLGVELELGLVDEETMALSSSIQHVLEEFPDEVGDCLKVELMQCVLEINTGICSTVAEAEADLTAKLKRVQAVTDRLGLRLWWGGTHPFSLWHDQQVTPNKRYWNLVSLLQVVARRLVTFGLHIHVGVDSGDKAVMICDRIMQHLPTFLALTCNSPYWENRDTGLQSYRSKIMEGLPTAGLPTLMRNWSEYVWLINHMIDTGFINSIREIWWDVRPHHAFGTVEVRVCDMPGNLDEVLAITAFAQCIIKALSDQIDEGTYQHDCHPMMVRQNKWRASRFGNRAQLVNSYTHEVQPVGKVVERLTDRLRETAQELNCLDHLLRLQPIADGLSGADAQKKIIEETSDPAEAVRQLTTRSRIE